MEMLITYFARDNIPVLPAGCSQLDTKQRCQTIDPFRALTHNEQAYTDACIAVNAFQAGDHKVMEKLMRGHHAFPETMLAAVYTQEVGMGAEILPFKRAELQRLSQSDSESFHRILQWLMLGCPTSRISEDAKPETSNTLVIQNQVTVHAALLCLRSPSFHTMLIRPEDLQQSFWPGATDSELAMIIDASGYVGW